MSSNTKIVIPGGTGANAPRSNFTKEQVAEIRLARKQGVSAMELATTHGVNVTTIHRIISERTYKKEAEYERKVEAAMAANSKQEKAPVSQAGAGK